MKNFIVDAHCDTMGKMVKEGCDLTSDNLHINLQDIKNMQGYVQLFATFIDTKQISTNPLVYSLKIIDKFYSQVKEFSDFVDIAYNSEDIFRIVNQGKCAGVLWVEGGEALCGELSSLRMLYKLGVRGMSLTWNYKNEIASGVEEEVDTGLTRFGVEVIKEMNKLGMIIDVSHMGELGFWKTLNYTNNPVIASHSNAKKICNHKRNLTDRQIKAISDLNGVIGINYYPVFLNSSGEATIDDVLKHIDYIAGLVGTKHVGLGSDFDGVDFLPKNLENLSKIDNILNELAKRNYTQEQIDDISGNNFLRVIKEVIG